MHIFPFVVSILSKSGFVKYEDFYKTSLNLISFNYAEVSELKKKLFCDHVIMQCRYFHTRLFYRKKLT